MIEPAMSLRDFFAAHVLVGLLAGDPETVSLQERSHYALSLIAKEDARIAYAYADAMLEARKT